MSHVVNQSLNMVYTSSVSFHNALKTSVLYRTNSAELEMVVDIFDTPACFQTIAECIATLWILNRTEMV